MRCDQRHADFRKHQAVGVSQRAEVHGLPGEVASARHAQAGATFQGPHGGVRGSVLERHEDTPGLCRIPAGRKCGEQKFIGGRRDA